MLQWDWAASIKGERDDNCGKGACKNCLYFFHLIATLTYFLLIYLNSRNCLQVQRYIRIKDLEGWRSGVQI